MPSADQDHNVPNDDINGGPSPPPDAPTRRLVLCFDGTGNKFQGDASDTNIVKIYKMLLKNTPGQYHYYQPGIGTYEAGAKKSSAGMFNFFSNFRSNLSMTLDQSLGSSFVDHVISGYQFVMRYYGAGDHIYIFGFSRGAYTARFLAEMIHNIGLLSKGNEEMVGFAWDTFSKFQETRGNVPQSADDKKTEDFMIKFKKTFCRPNVGIHFIGLFDCVNSVGQFEIPLFRNSYQYMASPAATHVRHAISIHERRLKFKPALFNFTPEDGVDCKEVWFAGNHADIGGGWGKAPGQKHLLSDIPLTWMIEEVLDLPGSTSRLEFDVDEFAERVKVEHKFPEHLAPDDHKGRDLYKKINQPHDMLKFGHGETYLKTCLWWLIEILPFFTRLELEKGKWVPRYWPPNLGAPRDRPVGSVKDDSVEKMIEVGILNADDIPPEGGDNSVVWGHPGKQKATDQTPLLNKQSGPNDA